MRYNILPIKINGLTINNVWENNFFLNLNKAILKLIKYLEILVYFDYMYYKKWEEVMKKIINCFSIKFISNSCGKHTNESRSNKIRIEKYMILL